MISSNPKIISVMNKNWYVETQTGLEGPFDSEKEALDFLMLMKSIDSDRMEFAGLQFSSHDKASN